MLYTAKLPHGSQRRLLGKAGSTASLEKRDPGARSACTPSDARSPAKPHLVMENIPSEATVHPEIQSITRVPRLSTRRN